MVIEIKRPDGFVFAIDTADIKEIGEHITGGTYIEKYDGEFLLLEQDYKTVKGILRDLGCEEIFSTSAYFILMSPQKFKMLKKRVKRVNRHNTI